MEGTQGVRRQRRIQGCGHRLLRAALEAAQQAIASPLLDDISINGSTGVLVNITGGQDLTLGEVNQISEVIHDAAGDQAEIIFGAVTEAAMEGEVMVAFTNLRPINSIFVTGIG